MSIESVRNDLVPTVIEQTNRGERAFDLYSRLLNRPVDPLQEILVPTIPGRSLLRRLDRVLKAVLGREDRIGPAGVHIADGAPPIQQGAEYELVVVDERLREIRRLGEIKDVAGDQGAGPQGSGAKT